MQYVRKNSQTEGQILDTAIHKLIGGPKEKQFYSIFKQRFLLVPEHSARRTPDASFNDISS